MWTQRIPIKNIFYVCLKRAVFYLYMRFVLRTDGRAYRWTPADESMGRVAGYGARASVTAGLTLTAVKHLLTARACRGRKGAFNVFFLNHKQTDINALPCSSLDSASKDVTEML